MRVTGKGDKQRLVPLGRRAIGVASIYINNERPVSAEELVNHNFEGDTVKTANEVPVFISRLRDKLGKSAIETVFGFGYRLTVGDEPAA